MPFEFKLPDIGEGVIEGEIVAWLVKEGEEVKEDQPLIEIMTDKATVEIHSPRAGIITRRIGKEGEVVPVGATLLVIDETGGGPAQAAAAGALPVSAERSAAGPAASASRATPPPAGAPAPAAEASAAGLATPAIRRLAGEMGIDLASVAGSGPQGRVTRQDLETAGGVAAAPPPGEERIPLRGLRKRIAEKMSRSIKTAAHFSYVEEVDVTSLVELHSRWEAQAAGRGVKITYLPLIVQAVVAALKKYPWMNAMLDENKQEIVLKKQYHVGIAVATEQGLVVPVVKDADRRSIWELAAEIQRLAEDARRGRSKLEDLQGSTFTITSLGSLGGLMATPIINYPEVAILGVHKIRGLPRYVGDTLQRRQIMNISLSIDHRIVDGMIGAEFVAEVKRLLEAPSPSSL
ncbi:MAG: 2-oxo acid dehydrogenase subunit E2 [Acidobacteria bacterium]|nr:2-oxo acid dehydrogenase subunit E2 [Acidobacteriota bacterium]